MNMISFIQWGFLLVQLVTAIFAIYCLHLRKAISWKLFLFIWPLTFLSETSGKVMAAFGRHNLWLYNLFDILFYPAILILFSQAFGSKKIKWASIFSALLFFFSSILFTLTGNANGLNTFFAITGSTLILVFSIAYLVKLFLDQYITTPLMQDCYYWFSCGFIVYFSFSAVMLGMHTKIVESKVSWLPYFIFYSNHLVTFILHLCLWTGFRAAYKWMK